MSFPRSIKNVLLIVRNTAWHMKKNLVVIGYGGMGHWHCVYAKDSDVVNLLGIYDIKEERRKAAKEAGIFAYESFEDVLCDERVDIVTIATPNDVHRELVIKALEAGKNVISEKPVTLSSDDLEAMIAASEKAGRIFTVHQNRRWDGDYLLLKKVYDSGVLGDVFCIESRVHGSRGIPGDWRCLKKYGGGMVYDWGVHLLDQALILTNAKLKSIYTHLDHITNDEVDDGCKIDLYFDNGLLYRVEVGTNNYINLPRFYMTGTDGTALIRDWDSDCNITSCHKWHEENVVPVKASNGLTKTMAPRDEKTITQSTVPQDPSDVHDFYRNICHSIDGKETQIVTHEQMRRVMKLIELVFESAEKDQIIHTDL